jgi:hypothetical protein
MDLEVAQEVYEQNYNHQLPWEQYIKLLDKGLVLVKTNPTDKIFINRYYNDEDRTAVNIALQYNQDLMIKLLR